ncbi:unnamed protein product [Psylliodes chrysocephalus]|uniref:NYN domain-containing protein n=1 Tax=Psylliodes chrysocephalus TaxID=3402493 RepID=A0A9P0CPY5_9CUCU|nr:unnamed protein product [Psylliodes chrysocephala]
MGYFMQGTFNILSQQSVADADVDIVLKAIETASGSYYNKVVIFSEDTDFLTMLAARTPPNLDVFLLKPPSARLPDVEYSSESLASRSACLRSHILFLHTFTGCDTTSAFFYRGKVTFCDLFEKSDDLHGFAEIFRQTHVAMDNLIDHGLRLALVLYGAPKTERTSDKPAIELDQSYQAKMYAKASNNKKVDLARIIPTANALTEPIELAYFQVQAWYGSQGQDETIDPLE